MNREMAKEFIAIAYAKTLRAENDSKITQALGIKFNADVKAVDDAEASALLQCCEIYNFGPEDVVLKNEIMKMNALASAYVMKQDGQLGPEFVLVKADDWAFIPHQFYYAYNKKGSPIKLTKNFGKNKFKGNKFASRPEVKRNFF